MFNFVILQTQKWLKGELTKENIQMIESDTEKVPNVPRIRSFLISNIPENVWKYKIFCFTQIENALKTA